MNSQLSDDLEMIERYFENTLTAEERTSVQERARHDESFRKLFDRERLLVKAVRIEAANRNLRHLQELENKRPKRGVEVKWYYLAAAASVALIALFIWTGQKEDSAELFAQYFIPHPNVFEPTVRGEATARTEAFQAYESRNYEKASALLNELTKSGEDPGVMMLLGNSYLAMGKTREAKEMFSRLIAGHDELDVAGKWYLSLCYLKDNEKDKAVETLREIEGTSSPYAARARSLLDDIN